jgi:uncharacterized protein YcbK (DUF882 family)
MNKELFKKEINNDDGSIASRRKFLKQIAYGSLLTMGGSSVASAAVRNVIYPAKRGQSHTQKASHNPVGHGSSHIQQVAHNIKAGHKTAHGHASHASHGHIHSHPIDPEIISRHASLSSGNYYTPSHKTLFLEHEHTGDSLKLTYFEQGHYVHGALEEINFLMRDYHTDDVHPIDTALLDQLFDLNEILGINKPIHIVSGYRSPFTNAQLRRNTPGVAEHSFHMQGRAIDIRIEGVHARTIKDAALSMVQGGVGYYPYNNFVHLDTGDIRTW